MKSKSPEGVTLEITDDTEKNLVLKREVIAKYLFNMAFENVQDSGYVTEKPWDALLAGTVDATYYHWMKLNECSHQSVQHITICKN